MEVEEEGVHESVVATKEEVREEPSMESLTSTSKDGNQEDEEGEEEATLEVIHGKLYGNSDKGLDKPYFDEPIIQEDQLVEDIQIEEQVIEKLHENGLECDVVEFCAPLDISKYKDQS